MPYHLRPYQLQFVDRCRDAFRRGIRRVLGVAPTGAGKTVMGCHIIERCVERGNRILWLAHRKELIDQCSAKLDENGINHGVIKSGHWRALPHLPVQVASVQTLARRREMPPADVVICDESHHCTSATYQAIYSHYPDALHLGLTATPYRTDGKGLGDSGDSLGYQELIEVATIPDLIAEGFLVEPIVYAPADPDLAGIKRVAGDYNRRQLGEAMDKPKLVGDLVKTWRQYAEGRTTVCFAVSIQHSQHIVEAFTTAGVRAAHLDATMDDRERAGVLDDLASGRINILSNMNILSEGWDLPQTSCVILARPTQSRGLHFQMIGRGLRSHPGKESAIILDHAGNTIRHGHVTEPQEFTLAGVAKRAKDAPPSVRVCPECFAVFAAAMRSCQQCKHQIPIVVRDSLPQSVDGELTRTEARPYLPNASDDQKRQKYAELDRQRASRGYRDGWVAHRFRVLYGHWPRPEDKRPEDKITVESRSMSA